MIENKPILKIAKDLIKDISPNKILQMANKCVKKCFSIIIIRDDHMRYPFIPIRMATIRRTENKFW